MSLTNMGMFKSKRMSFQTKDMIDSGGNMHAEESASIVGTNSITFSGSTLSAGKTIHLATASFTCTNSKITAPDIYLPPKSHLDFSNCQLNGNVHYYEESFCGNPSDCSTHWCEAMDHIV